MKRHSILTTLFPRLGFAKQSISQLLQAIAPDDVAAGVTSLPLLPWLGRLERDEEHDAWFAFVPGFLPSFKINEKNVQFHLHYCELPSDHPILRHADNPAVVQVVGQLTNLEGEIEEIKVGGDELLELPPEDRPDATTYRQSLFTYFWKSIRRNDVSQLHFQMTVFVTQGACLEAQAQSEADFEKAAQRREYVAREITTGYRRVISLALLLISCGAYNQKQKSGRSVPTGLLDVASACHVVHFENGNTQSATSEPPSELHATREDGWRLICTFHSVEVCAKKANRIHTPKQQCVLGLQDFIDSLILWPWNENQLPTATVILDSLFKEKGIQRQIALRKTFEYYIFEALPCMPVSC